MHITPLVGTKKSRSLVCWKYHAWLQQQIDKIWGSRCLLSQRWLIDTGILESVTQQILCHPMWIYGRAAGQCRTWEWKFDSCPCKRATFVLTEHNWPSPITAEIFGHFAVSFSIAHPRTRGTLRIAMPFTPACCGVHWKQWAKWSVGWASHGNLHDVRHKQLWHASLLSLVQWAIDLVQRET